MSLLDDLRQAAGALDIQFQPASNEIQGILGALVHYAEHGNAFLQAAEAGAEDVSKLLVPEPEPEPVAPPAPVSGSAPTAEPATDDELRRQLADLQAQLDTRSATAQQTQLEHETSAPADPAPAPSSNPLSHLLGRKED